MFSVCCFEISRDSSKFRWHRNCGGVEVSMPTAIRTTALSRDSDAKFRRLRNLSGAGISMASKFRWRRKLNTNENSITSTFLHDFCAIEIPMASKFRRSRNFDGVEVSTTSKFRWRRGFDGIEISMALKFRWRRNLDGVESSKMSIFLHYFDVIGLQQFQLDLKQCLMMKLFAYACVLDSDSQPMR